MKRTSIFKLIPITLSMLIYTNVDAARWYVDPAGSDAASGTESEPFASMTKGQTAAAPGDTVYFRGGVYKFTSSTAADGVDLTKSGTSGKRINYWAYPGEVPVFDFFGMTALQRIKGLNITASYIHLKGLELKGVPQNLRTVHESWGIYVNGGSNNIFELLNLHHHMGPGLFIVRGSNNLVLNCDSHHNYDQYSSSNGTDANAPGENADGFGCHVNQAGNTGNIFRGCRAWWNTDDGWDLIQAQEVVIIENCWTWYNGYLPGTTTAIGNGNGFKAGGYGLPPTNVPSKPPQHIVRNCISFLNRSAGFYANHHPVACFWYNNTAYNNKSSNFNMLGVDVSSTSYPETSVGILRNNIAFTGTATTNSKGVDATFNTWNLTSVTVSAADFLSVDMAGVDGPRQADGSLPNINFLKLAPGSDLIDKGTDIGIAKIGTAPDLGAFESGATSVKEIHKGKLTPIPSNNIKGAQAFDLRGRNVSAELTGITNGVFMYRAVQSNTKPEMKLIVKMSAGN
jgi:hypothetical protein